MYIYCLYTPSHIPLHSVFITANGTHAQPGEKSLFTEESRNTPWESTRIQDSSWSQFSIKYFRSNYVAMCIVLPTTCIQDSMKKAWWWYRSVVQWWEKPEHWIVHQIIWHQRRRFGSPTGGSSSMSGTPGEVIINSKESTDKETEPGWYCHCTPSALKFPKSSSGNGSTTAQMTKVHHPQQMIQVRPFINHPGDAVTQVYWSPWRSTTLAQWRWYCIPTPERCF